PRKPEDIRVEDLGMQAELIHVPQARLGKGRRHAHVRETRQGDDTVYLRSIFADDGKPRRAQNQVPRYPLFVPFFSFLDVGGQVAQLLWRPRGPQVARLRVVGVDINDRHCCQLSIHSFTPPYLLFRGTLNLLKSATLQGCSRLMSTETHT